MMGQGHLYVFEGADGVGTSALSKRFAEELASRGVPCEHLGFPGSLPGTLGHHVYRLHHHPEQLDVRSIMPTALQLLHIAAHVDAIEAKILPLLRRGTAVVLDRYWWSTFVYGLVAGVPRTVIERMIQVETAAWQHVVPTAAFLIRRNSPLRPEPVDLWSRWRDTYDDLARTEMSSYPVHVVENEGLLDDTLAQLVSIANSGSGGAGTISPSTTASKGNSRGLLVFSSLSPARPTKVFDTYWRFAAERQAVFFRRLRGLQPPWTTDAILREYKFTNAYRASDRVSQFLIRSVAYDGDNSPEELFFRIVLFKLFNRIETWRMLVRVLGEISYSKYSFAAYDRVLTEAMAAGETVYSAAYIMPTGNRLFGTVRKHQAHLRLLERMMEDEVPLRLRDAPSMSAAFQLLRSYPMLGDFLAYQYVTDLNYSQLTDFSEMDFVVPGPGARDGIAKCFGSLGGLTETDLIKIVAERQEEEFAERGIDFPTLWGRRLQLIDCQNLFCEVDKYARVKHPDVPGRQSRVRIKQRFSPKSESIGYWYPPKWGLNVRIAGERSRGDRNGTDF